MNLMSLMMSVVLNDAEARRSLEDLTIQAEHTGQKFKNVGVKMAQIGGAVSIGVGAIGAAMYSLASDADNANRKIQATLGLTATEAKEVSDQARLVWKAGFTGSMEEASDAVLAVKQQMSQLNDADLSKITQQAMSISKTFDEDVGQVSRAADTMMKTFGISAEEAMDKITVGFQNGLNYSDEFIDSIAEYSVYFDNMGMSADDMLNVMVAGMNNGAFQLDKVGDAIKENFLRLSDMGKGEMEAISDLGLNAQQVMDMINEGGEEANKAYEMVNMAIAGVSDETERNAITVALYGVQAEDVGKKVSAAMMSAGDVIGDTTGKAQALNDTVSQSPAQQMAAQWNTLKDSLVPLATTLMELAMQVLPYVSTGVEKISGFISKMSPEMQKAVIVGGAIAGVLGSIAVAVFPVISSVGSMIPIFTKVLGVIVRVGGTIGKLGTPIGIAITAITAIIAIGKLLYENWDDIEKFGKKIWNGIGNFISDSIDSASDAVSSGMDWIDNKFQKVTKGISVLTKAGFKLIGDYIKDPIGTAKNLTEKALELLDEKFDGAGTKIKENVKSAFEKAKSFIVDPIEEAKEKVSTAIDKIKGFFTGLELKLPEIKLPKLPKIELGTTKKTIFGKEIDMPSIKWNAKGAVFNKPTIFNTANQGLQGVGEQGKEAVAPIDTLTGYVKEAVTDVMGQKGKGNINIEQNFYVNKHPNEVEIVRLTKKSLEQLGFAW